MLLALLLACASPPPGGSDPPTGDSPSTSTSPCAEGEVLDGDTCVPEACGTGTWGEVEGTIFVDGSAGDGGDGSQQAPFATVGEALEAASEGDVVAVAAGTYAETLSLTDAGRTIAGRCAELVTLQSEGPDTEPVVKLTGASAELSGLTIDGRAERSGLVAWPAGAELTLVLREVVVWRAGGSMYSGLFFINVAGTLDDVQIIDQGASDGFSGLALAGSDVEARRLVLRDLDAVPLQVDNSTLLLQDSVIDGGEYVGLLANPGARVTVDGLSVSRIRAPEGISQNTCCPAVYAAGDPKFDWRASITGTGLTVTDSEAALWAAAAGEIRLTDVSLSDLGVSTNIAGIVAEGGGRVELADLTVERATGVAAWAVSGGQVVLRNAEILDTRLGGGARLDGATDAAYAVGAFALGGEIDLEGVRIDGAYGNAIMLADDGWGAPSAVLADVTIQHVDPPPTSGRNAKGVYLLAGTLEARDLSVKGVDGPGIAQASFFDEPTDLDCTDCSFEDVALAGVVVVGSTGGAQARIDGCTVQNVALDESSGLSTGLLATNAGGVPDLEASGCEVSGTRHGALVVSGEAAVQVRDSALEGGSGALVSGVLEVHGNAVYATGTSPWDGERGLLLENNRLTRGAGELVLLHGASATLSGNTWDGGELRQQHCEGTSAVAGADEAPTFTECPDTDVVVVEIDARPVGLPPIEDAF